MSDLDRIVSDLTRARQRIADLESGALGQSTDGHHTRVRALENQINAQRGHAARLEYELVLAMLAEHKWSPAEVIRRMSA